MRQIRSPSENFRRVLGRVTPAGLCRSCRRTERIMAQAEPANAGRGLLLLMEPSAGVSELLRQAYDKHLQSTIRSHSNLLRDHTQAKLPPSAPRSSFSTLSSSSTSLFAETNRRLSRAVDLAGSPRARTRPRISNGSSNSSSRTPTAFQQRRQSARSLLSRRATTNSRGTRSSISMLDGSQLAEYLNGAVVLGTEILRVFGRGGFLSFSRGCVARFSKRRMMRSATSNCSTRCVSNNSTQKKPLRSLNTSRVVSKSQPVKPHAICWSNSSPAVRFSSASFYKPHARNTAAHLVSRLRTPLRRRTLRRSHPSSLRRPARRDFAPARHASSADSLAVGSGCRRRTNFVVRSLAEASAHDRDRTGRRAAPPSRAGVCKLGRDDGRSRRWPTSVERLLKIRYRLDVLNEPRALVVADVLADSLKRAPHTMARHYKQIANAGLRELISRFNCQRVPADLFDYT